MRIEKRHAAMLGVVIALFALSRYDGSLIPDILPDDSPIDVDGLHVLVLYESAEKHRLTPGQADVIEDITHAGELRKWIASIGTLRVYDDDVGDQNADQWVRDAIALHDGQTIPWLLIANSRSGYTGELPEGVPATRALVEGFVE